MVTYNYALINERRVNEALAQGNIAAARNYAANVTGGGPAVSNSMNRMSMAIEAAQSAANRVNAAASVPGPSGDGGGGGGGGGGGYTGPTAEEIAAAQERMRREAARNSAWDDMQAILSSWDISGDILNTIKGWVWEDRSKDYILMNFRKSDPYNKRFTGMAALISRGQFMPEGEYIALERSYRNLMAQWDLPKGFYDSYDDFGGFIANGVSVAELDDRIQSAKTILDQGSDPAYREALQQLGAGTGDMLAYVIDPNKAQNLIQRKLRGAAFGGAARLSGFAAEDLSVAEFDRYGASLGDQYNDINSEELAKLQARLGVTGMTASRDQFLSSLDRDEAFRKVDILDAEFLGDTNMALLSQRRAEREQNRFKKRSGLGRNALGDTESQRGV